jgi:ribosomal protein S18 acetylase RimI-like enzyme
MKMNCILRDACKEEARDLAILVNYAGTGPNDKGLDYVGWGHAANEGEGPFDYGGRIIESEDGQYSHQNIRVLEVDGSLVGMALCFEVFKRTDVEMNFISEEFRIFKELTNTIPGSFYLDSLAISPEFRGKGYGQIMLEDSIKKARSQRYNSIYLIAFVENIAGVALYKKNNFYEVHRKPSNNHPIMPYTGDVVLYKKDI